MSSFNFNELDLSYQGLIMTGGFFILWAVLYVASGHLSGKIWPVHNKLTKEKKVEWNSRVVSTIHAVMAVAGVINVFFFDPEYSNPSVTRYNRRGEFSFASSWDGVFVAAITLSYWYYDLILTIVHWKAIGDWKMLLHHAVGIVPFTAGMYLNELVYFAAMIILTEVSTPFVNNRWFFAELNIKGPAYVYNGVLMWLSFLAFRVIWLPILLWSMVNHMGEYWFAHKIVWIPVFVGTSVTAILSYFWFFLITKGMLKALKGSSGAPASTGGAAKGKTNGATKETPAASKNGKKKQ